jgi:hypothetical protein
VYTSSPPYALHTPPISFAKCPNFSKSHPTNYSIYCSWSKFVWIFFSLRNLFIFSEIEDTSLGKWSVHTSNDIVRIFPSSEAPPFGNCRFYFGKRLKR